MASASVNVSHTVLSSKINDDVDKQCRKCKNKVSNAWSCVKCHTYFHKSCALVVQEMNNKLIFLSNNELVCDKCCGDSNESVSSNSSTSSAQDVLKFLNSDEFSNLLNKMVDKAVSPLMIEIKKLRDEVQILKSNIFEKNATRETQYSSLKLPCWDDDRLSEKSSVLSSNEIEGNVFTISGNSDKKGPQKNLDKTSFKRNANLRSAVVEDNQNVYEPNKNAPVKSDITNATSKTRVMKTLIIGTSQVTNENGDALEDRSNECVCSANDNMDNIQSFELKQLNSKFPDKYSSFKLSIDFSLIEKVLDPSFWPIGIAVRKYFSPRSVRRQSYFQKTPDHQTQS
ncbi:hypothetical protein Zmor_024663 [Zophobas morio]|uniref:Uncharacterized protein n=1 Tax=Zophobas morio TaxID=2755281 RepID=A0AA38I3N4_9CUCU|nr:hypothetical protein Zmor_024663 [Zophobas morio]